MCYFEQTRWACGFWKWGNFREQCTKEYHTGETCGLKLIFETKYEKSSCRSCGLIERKGRRITKMMRNVERWKRDGNCPATLEKTEGQIAELENSIAILSDNTEGNFSDPNDSGEGVGKAKRPHRVVMVIQQLS
jgi:hypothetical protein